MPTQVVITKSKVKSLDLCLFTSAFLLSLYSSGAWAQAPAEAQQLFSPSVGQRFHEIACEIANADNVTNSEIEQAIIFLTATMDLDSRASLRTQKGTFGGRANYVVPDMIKLASRHSERDSSQLMYQMLGNYLEESVDLEPVREALSYLLEQMNSREQREQLLAVLLQELGPQNEVFGSELATLLGLLMAEKADLVSATSYFERAYALNRYNKLAFEKLVELVPEQIEPAVYLENLRLRLSQNPLDLEAALNFAEYAERLQIYEVAAAAYEYSADLFGYLHPADPLPARIHLAWAISCYNTQRDQPKCLKIASEFRQSGRFDLFLEAIAARAAEKIGDQQHASRILTAAEAKAIQLLEEGTSPQVSHEQLAWFYCFVLKDAGKALDRANKAYSLDPNSPAAAAILAYALVMNGQTDAAWVGMLIDKDNYERNQIAELVMAQIQQAQDKGDGAIKTLKSAIDRDPGSLVAERAKEILAQLGGEYIPPTDPGVALAVLRNTFGHAIVPRFVTPDRIISVQLNVRGSKFYYGSRFGGNLAITNNSSEPLIVSDDSLFIGNIRVDARVSGDLNRRIPNLVSMKVRPAKPIEPGQSVLIPLRLVTGELRQVLLTYPQASLDIKLSAFIDPVITEDGQVVNRLADVKPAETVIKRPAVELTRRYLQNRLSSLTTGKSGQKIKTAQLFTGLLAEQQAMANREPLYEFMYADWMPPLLKSALVRNLTDEDWTVRVHTMTGMLSLPLDFELIDAVAENLNDTRWPVRLMAVFLLSKAQNENFRKVLDWAAKYDPNNSVRYMAVALGGSAPQRQEQPQPAPPTP